MNVTKSIMYPDYESSFPRGIGATDLYALVLSKRKVDLEFIAECVLLSQNGALSIKTWNKVKSISGIPPAKEEKQKVSYFSSFSQWIHELSLYANDPIENYLKTTYTSANLIKNILFIVQKYKELSLSTTEEGTIAGVQEKVLSIVTSKPKTSNEAEFHGRPYHRQVNLARGLGDYR